MRADSRQFDSTVDAEYTYPPLNRSIHVPLYYADMSNRGAYAPGPPSSDHLAAYNNQYHGAMDSRRPSYQTVEEKGSEGSRTPAMGAAGAQSGNFWQRLSSRGRKLLILGLLVLLVIIAVAIAVPVALSSNNDDDSSSSNQPSDRDAALGGGADSSASRPTRTGASASAQPSASAAPVQAVWGGDGSTVETEDGTSFIYSNPFGT